MDDRGAEVEAVLDRLRRQGFRITGARRAIVAALAAGPDHLSAEDLATRVARHHPGVNLATVYRTLAVLTHRGVVERHDLGPGPATYHRSGLAHYHLVCRSCGRVVLVPPSAFDRLAEDLRSYGFEVDGHRASVAGRCATCAGHRSPRSSRREGGRT